MMIKTGKRKKIFENTEEKKENISNEWKKKYKKRNSIKNKESKEVCFFLKKIKVKEKKFRWRI